MVVDKDIHYHYILISVLMLNIIFNTFHNFCTWFYLTLNFKYHLKIVDIIVVINNYVSFKIIE